jgi:hypothetical protein
MRRILQLIACYSVGAVCLLAQQVTLSPSIALRNEPIYATMKNAAAFQSAEVRLGDRTFAASRFNDNTVMFRVPTDFPLGSARLLIMLDGRQQFEAENKLPVVESLAGKVGITHVEPEVVNAAGGQACWTISGQNFAKDPKDIRVFVNNSEQKLNWVSAETKPNEQCAYDKPTGIVKSTTELEILGVPVKEGKLVLGIRQGDDMANATNELSVTIWQRWQVLLVAAVVTLFGSIVVYILLSFQGVHIVKGREYRIRALFMDKSTNTYSLSILQFHMWTIAAVFGYTYFALSKLFVQWASGLPDISGNLPGIVGIGIGTAVGSQVINTVRPKGSGDEGPSPSDFVTSGGSVAADRVQMLVWTIVAVAGFLAGVIRENPATIKNLPGVPESLMALMGLSSLGYLGAKFARKPGPNITEISIIPAFAQATGKVSAMAAGADISQPLAVATQTLQAVKTMAAGLSATSTTVAVREATAAVSALEAGVAAASTIQKSGQGTDGLAKLADLSVSSHAAAMNAAAEFDKSTGSPGAETARLSASIAQRAAAAVEELSSSSGQIVSVAEAASNQKAQDAAAAFRRVIEFRGQNLSSEGIFRASIGTTEFDLPFRMLEMKDNRRVPEVVVVEESSGSPTIGRTLRLTIVPSQLDAVDAKTYEAIFGQEHKDLTFTIFNPDGQKSVKTVALPSGEAQRVP